jgi:hypothetical protein
VVEETLKAKKSLKGLASLMMWAVKVDLPAPDGPQSTSGRY